ncbi:hypothetical protein [Butyrivibrio sp. AD3002]|uniref:hypothetical protein n=1 Tax=Butyrivibrio sp. AD3002 TaxID=1280670 RepID=UPI0003B38E43|nr:hypothetical protein [Butyrivibrio sp. AD3002]
MNEKRERLSEYLMYFVLSIWFSTEIIFNTNLEYVFWWKKTYVNALVKYICLALLVVQIIILQHYNAKEMILLTALSIPMVLGTLNSDYNIMISTWLFIVASKYIDFDKFARIAYIALILMMLLVFYLYFFGWIDDTTIFRGNLLRHSWGYTHPNWLGIRVFQIILLHCYIRRDKLFFIDYAVVFLGAWFVDRVPNCKTAYYALIFFLVALLFGKLMDCFEDGDTFFAKVLILIAIVSNIVSVVLSVINVKAYPVLKAFDTFMSKRFSWCHKTLKYYGITLFGRNIELYTRRMNSLVRKFYVDTAYMAILIRYGIVVFCIFSILYICAMIYLFRARNYFLILIMSLYAVYGIMENTFFSMNQNIFLLLLAFPLYQKKALVESKYIKKQKPRIRIVL